VRCHIRHQRAASTGMINDTKESPASLVAFVNKLAGSNLHENRIVHASYREKILDELPDEVVVKIPQGEEIVRQRAASAPATSETTKTSSAFLPALCSLERDIKFIGWGIREMEASKETEALQQDFVLLEIALKLWAQTPSYEHKKRHQETVINLTERMLRTVTDVSGSAVAPYAAHAYIDNGNGSSLRRGLQTVISRFKIQLVQDFALLLSTCAPPSIKASINKFRWAQSGSKNKDILIWMNASLQRVCKDVHDVR
jgi:hypothetical protein